MKSERRLAALSVFFAVLFLILSAINVSAQTMINNCTTISSPGVYVLNQSIMDSTDKICINITSSNVIFDGTGNTIDGVDLPDTYGIYVYNPTRPLTNVTIKNLKITDWETGIYHYLVADGNITSNTLSSNYYGINLGYSRSVTISNNYFNNTLPYYESQDIDGNTITNDDITKTPYAGFLEHNWIAGNDNFNTSSIDITTWSLNKSDITHNTGRYSKVGIRFDANGDGDVADIDDQTIYNDIRIGSKTLDKIIITPAMRMGDINANLGKVFTLKGTKYRLRKYEPEQERVLVLPTIEKTLLPPSPLLGQLDIIDSIPGTDIRLGVKNIQGIYRITADFLIIRGGAITEEIKNVDVTNPTKDLELLGDYYIMATDYNVTLGYVKLAISKKSDEFTIYDEKKNILGYSKAVIENSSWTNNELRFEDESIEIKKDSHAQLSTTRIYAKYTENNEFDLVSIIGLKNYWNTSKTAGTNIIGGPYIGGNFWANPSGTGFSETCSDADVDGICDSSYWLAADNIDYLPMTMLPSTKLSVAIITNSIDKVLAQEFFGFLKNQGIGINVVNASEFEKVKTSKFLIILGGPDAPEGIGEIVKQLISEDEQKFLRRRGNRKMYTLTNNYATGQVIHILAGSDRAETKNAHAENKQSIVAKVKGS